jgi:dTDP-4-dehydrorhamnose reductase
MKVLVIGADGQLGTDLCRVLKDSDLIPLTQSEIEIISMDSIEQAFAKYRPDVVINTAAFVRVDDCEIEQDKAYQVNALGARNVAVQSRKMGVKLVHISTDYVFGGETVTPKEGFTEFDTPVPLSIYGKSKLAGEELVKILCHKHYIVRTSGLFGVAGALGKGGNFIETMLKLAKEKSELRVVNDQIFSPTYTLDLAGKIGEIIKTENYGTFHITNSGICSWYEFTKEILKQAGLKTPVIPVTSAQYPQKAKRPNYSVLRNYQLYLLGMAAMRPWQEALADYLKEKGHVDKLPNYKIQ